MIQCENCRANCFAAGTEATMISCRDYIPQSEKTWDYVVRYHPEGWRDAKLESPDERDIYWVAFKFDNERWCGECHWDGEDWFTANGVEVTHWVYLPTPPWEIFPKENTDA